MERGKHKSAASLHLQIKIAERERVNNRARIIPQGMAKAILEILRQE
jgi:hypothetical protein